MKYYTSSTQFNCGIDLHARQMYVCLMDRDGQKLVQEAEHSTFNAQRSENGASLEVESLPTSAPCPAGDCADRGGNPHSRLDWQTWIVV